jgi:hypothetical protein
MYHERLDTPRLRRIRRTGRRTEAPTFSSTGEAHLHTSLYGSWDSSDPTIKKGGLLKKVLPPADLASAACPDRVARYRRSRGRSTVSGTASSPITPRRTCTPAFRVCPSCRRSNTSSSTRRSRRTTQRA